MDVQQKLPIGTEVRFTSEWLSRLSPDQSRRYAGRVGYIHGYRAQREGRVPEPIVVFPKHGRFKELKLYEVPWGKLELALEVESQP